MAKFEWGAKRTCQSCAATFYDLRKNPITCPKCGSTQEIITSTRAKRGKADKKALVTDDALLADDETETKSNDDNDIIEDDIDLDSDLDVLNVKDESIDER